MKRQRKRAGHPLLLTMEAMVMKAEKAVGRSDQSIWAAEDMEYTPTMNSAGMVACSRRERE